MKILNRMLNVGEAKQLKGRQQTVSLINAFEPELELDDDLELRERFDALRAQVMEAEDKDKQMDKVLPEVFAIVREVSRRTTGMRHYDEQMVGGMVLHSGQIAEMKTGEGKTLTATLAVVLNAMSGRGVHLVTVNDYLAKRDAEWMGAIYTFLGLRVGVLQGGQDFQAKHHAYRADITYGTNSEFGFDFLRDNMATAADDVFQRGHAFAIVDEVDNILIDEARTPLIISGAAEQSADLYAAFARLARGMRVGKKPDSLSPLLKRDWVADYDYEIDEKHKTVSITEQGVAKAEKFLKISHLYRAENGPLVNHLMQALKAESLYRLDVDYAVVDGEVQIIDEFTGRIMEGRRWSEGLHQAIEAKEGVLVQDENLTQATITYQNFFRLYQKLAGMTGTAMTEAIEFMKIYKLQTVAIPTHEQVIRVDHNDLIYKTKEAKWRAVCQEIEERHAEDQPVLVGTVSVEVSELLSRRLKKLGVPHTVLNAKPEYAAMEGLTVSQAGRPGAVTIATNMAGRGVDIKLGGEPEILARIELQEKLGLREGEPDFQARLQEVLPVIRERIEEDQKRVLAAGGLFILGTERHESRRIDNQLRGRAGRQGDPGASRFYLSAEDDLVRLFAGDKIYNIMDRFAGSEDEPMTMSMLTKQIAKAQEKVEEQHYLTRKRVLEYDDVMNEQRRVVYRYRDDILRGVDLSQTVQDKLGEVAASLSAEYCGSAFAEDWDFEGLLDALAEMAAVTQLEQVDPELAGELERATEDPENLEERVADFLRGAHARRAQELGPELTPALERYLLLTIIDERWREHLYDMDYLREGIHLRGFAQVEPIVAYKNESYILFQELMSSIWQQFTRWMLHAEVEIDQEAYWGFDEIPALPQQELIPAGGGLPEPESAPPPANREQRRAAERAARKQQKRGVGQARVG